LHERLQVGVEYNPVADEIGPLFTLFAITETETRPAFFLGASSDRIGSPPGTQSYYATTAKYLPFAHLAVYASLNYSEWDDAFNFPLGVTAELGKDFSLRHMYDGDRSHLLLNYFPHNFGVSLMYIWYERFGISLSAGF